MTRLNIIVEGQTEEGFAKTLITDHLRRHDVHVHTMIVPTKAGARARVHRGGINSYATVKKFVRRKVTDDLSAYTTTLFDYHGLPSDFPGVGSSACPPPSRPFDRAEYLEQEFAKDLGSPRNFIPYFQLHEFEALLFSDVEILDQDLRSLDDQSYSRLRTLQRIIDDFETPENINDDPQTVPSKRILDAYPGYQKVPFGELVAESIGLNTIRAECPRFGRWLTHLETLDNQQN
jgi:hypothetical protein